MNWLREKIMGGKLYGDNERLLTSGEEKLIRDVFKRASLPPMSWIRIRDGLSPTGTAITIRDGNDFSIMVGPTLFDGDLSTDSRSTLVHEMTHVWQWHHGMLTKAHALTAHAHAGIRRKAGYYDDLYDYNIFTDTWEDMGFEGQAQLVEDWFVDGIKPLGKWDRHEEDEDMRFCFIKRVIYDDDASARKLNIYQLCEKSVIDIQEASPAPHINQSDDSLVQIPGDLLFDFNQPPPGRFDLKPGADTALKQAATTILRSASATRRQSRVLINGHTDSKGDASYNMDLSVRRAEAVARWFSSNGYLPRSVISVQGFGLSQPVAPNKKRDGSDDPVGRAKNRRVEIYVTNT